MNTSSSPSLAATSSRTCSDIGNKQTRKELSTNDLKIKMFEWASLQDYDGNHDIQKHILHFVVTSDYCNIIYVCKQWKNLILNANTTDNSDTTDGKILSNVIQYMFNKHALCYKKEYLRTSSKSNNNGSRLSSSPPSWIPPSPPRCALYYNENSVHILMRIFTSMSRCKSSSLYNNTRSNNKHRHGRSGSGGSSSYDYCPSSEEKVCSSSSQNYSSSSLPSRYYYWPKLHVNLRSLLYTLIYDIGKQSSPNNLSELFYNSTIDFINNFANDISNNIVNDIINLRHPTTNSSSSLEDQFGSKDDEFITKDNLLMKFSQYINVINRISNVSKYVTRHYIKELPIMIRNRQQHQRDRLFTTNNDDNHYYDYDDDDDYGGYNKSYYYYYNNNRMNLFNNNGTDWFGSNSNNSNSSSSSSSSSSNFDSAYIYTFEGQSEIMLMQHLICKMTSVLKQNNQKESINKLLFKKQEEEYYHPSTVKESNKLHPDQEGMILFEKAFTGILSIISEEKEQQKDYDKKNYDEEKQKVMQYIQKLINISICISQQQQQQQHHQQQIPLITTSQQRTRTTTSTFATTA